MSAKGYSSTAKRVLQEEAKAVRYQVEHLDEGFENAVETLVECSGRVVVMGLGKSGLIGRKISATMSSVGIPSVFQHPAECLHGDLGMLMPNDAVIFLSYTGETDEIKKVLPVVKRMGLPVIVMTGRRKAPAWKQADHIIDCGVEREACPFDLAPTSSTTAMLAMGDALALCASEKKGFKKEHLARFHPSGGIGKKLTVTVRDIMRSGRDNPVLNEAKTVYDALLVMTATRLGATNVVDRAGRLVGFFTDGDLRRKLQDDKQLLQRTIRDVMTKSPLTIQPEMLAVEAAKVLKKHSFDNIPVVNKAGKPVGVLDERDLLAEGIV